MVLHTKVSWHPHSLQECYWYPIPPLTAHWIQEMYHIQKPSLAAVNEVMTGFTSTCNFLGSIWCEKINFQVKMNWGKETEAFGRQDKHWLMAQIQRLTYTKENYSIFRPFLSPSLLYPSLPSLSLSLLKFFWYLIGTYVYEIIISRSNPERPSPVFLKCQPPTLFMRKWH